MDNGDAKDSKHFNWEKFVPQRNPENIQEFIVYQKLGQDTNKYIIKKFDKTKEQNLEMLNLIKEILENTANLSPHQIIEYCNCQRYFMKLYFKQLQKK